MRRGCLLIQRSQRTSINVTNTTTAAQIQANLRAIPALASSVNVTGDNGGPWTLTFVGSLSGQDVPDLVVESGSPRSPP